MKFLKVKVQSFYPAVRINGSNNIIHSWKVKYVNLVIFGIVIHSKKHVINLVKYEE